MGVLVQIRDVPEEVHRKLKARAAAQGVSMSEYVRGVLERSVAKPTPEEFWLRVEARGSVELDPPIEETIREIRGPIPPP